MFGTIVLVIIAAIIIWWFIRSFISWGIRWGATEEEYKMKMTGDVYLEGGYKLRMKMTRAISITQPPDTVWPWLAQLGRGAGWYSVDRLDNGGKDSARHIVSWIPELQLGDASAIGYLRFVDPGRELVWWVSGEKWSGSFLRMVVDMQAIPEKEGTRLVIRMSGDAFGSTAGMVVSIFQIMDTIMARKQLLGIKERVEKYKARTIDPARKETGAVDQFQEYEVIYTSGERAGVNGKEKAEYWRQTAKNDGIL